MTYRATLTGLPLACVPLLACSLLHPLDPLKPPWPEGGAAGVAGAAGSAGLDDAKGGAADGVGGFDAAAGNAVTAGAGPTASAAGGTKATGGAQSTGGAKSAGAASNGYSGAAGAPSGGRAAAGESGVGGGQAPAQGTCQKDDTRSCVEAGLDGPCAQGTQVCDADGRWGQCSILPEASDTCEAGNDANCNGSPNEGCACTVGSTRPCEDALGHCAEGVESCLSDGSGWSECNILPESADSCEPGDDANCNGLPNEGCPCVEGETQPCGPEDEVGICHPGESTCTASGTWGACEGAVSAEDRDCRSDDDNNCNGVPDNEETEFCKCAVGEEQACDTHVQDGTGICKAGSQTCVALQYGTASDWNACSGSVGPKARDCASSLDNDCNGVPDNGTGGPEFVKLPEGYCIDSTEVTRAQYQAWLDSVPAPSMSGQPLGCGWNISYEPDATCMAGSDVCNTDCADHPRECVDWCDAYAYCQAVHKRLCGKIGGGTNSYADPANAESSQWYNACTSHGANDFTYGDAYEPQTCNVADYTGPFGTATVASFPDCESEVSGYEDIFDLTGNVAEWEDSCEAQNGETDNCRFRGGAFGTIEVFLRCDMSSFNLRNHAEASLGFRCCSP